MSTRAGAPASSTRSTWWKWRARRRGPVFPRQISPASRSWFAAYTEWMNTHPYGIAERDAKNNHGTCWVAQVAAFSELTGNAKLTAYCRDRFETVLIPNQEKPDGSFPEELRRTKPYGYSLFNLDALGDHRADSGPVEVDAARRTRHGASHGVYVPVHAR